MGNSLVGKKVRIVRDTLAEDTGCESLVGLEGVITDYDSSFNYVYEVKGEVLDEWFNADEFEVIDE